LHAECHAIILISSSDDPSAAMRLILLRHAKSSWDDPDLRDHDRPLAPRGIRAAPAMGRHFADTDLQVDRIVSSTAARARATARMFVDSFGMEVPMVERSDLYHADDMDMLAIAREEWDGRPHTAVMLVGHNPGMHDLAVYLCEEGRGSLVDRLHRKFPTGALAEFELPDGLGDETPPGSARLVQFVRPKDLPDAQRLRL
jgi:phosphohistidine phosphatase